MILASSENHDDSFVLVPEEHLTHITNWPGKPTEQLIRADLAYIETEAGGAIFSTGSITFCGSLPVNNFQNNISPLLDNVFHRFLPRKRPCAIHLYGQRHAIGRWISTTAPNTVIDTYTVNPTKRI